MKPPVPLNRTTLARFALPPVVDGDKNEHGRLLIVAGSRDIAGAALLSALGAMRAGAGKLRIATVASAAPQLAMAMPEAMVLGLAEDRAGAFARSAVAALAELVPESDAVVAGPGMAASSSASALAASLCRSGVKLALDAALLHALPPCAEAARRSDQQPILLPHHGELASLLGSTAADVAADPLAAGRQAAVRYDSLTLVKGPQSLIVAPDGRAFAYRGGGPGLGVSGSGDMLAGIVGGLLARGAAPLTALLWAVWLHGESGRRLARRIGPVGFLAREIADEVPALLPR